MKKILITGIGGFIGSHFLEHVLVNTDWHVMGIASWRHKGMPERITDSKHYQQNKDRVEIFTHDLNAPVSDILKRKLAECNYIVNFAAESHVDRSLTDPVPFITNNVNVVLNMLELARAIQPEKFIQISTDEVYGPMDNDIPHVEYSQQRPSNPYSASKSCQEMIAFSYWRSFQVPVIVTNTMNNFGERQDSEKFIPLIMKKVMNNEVVTIHGAEGNIGSRYWLHARNHADAVLFILKNIKPRTFPENKVFERFNIVGDVRLDNLEIAQKVAMTMGKELKYELEDFHSTRPGHDPHYGLDGRKLAEAGWEIPQNFEETLKRTVDWTMDRSEWL